MSIEFQKRCLLIILFITTGTNLHSQEWQAWSDWEKSGVEEDLSYRQRIKYTTSDTYAVQIEWKNQSKFDIKVQFEIVDRRKIKETRMLTIPAEATRGMYGGTSFKSNRIKVHLLKYEFCVPTSG